MLKKKLLSLGILSVTMFNLLSALPVHAAATTTPTNPTGTSDIKYTPGTAGSTGKIDPTNSETDGNNWMVSYPRTIVLTDNHKVTEAEYPTKKANGKALNFTVKQQIAGADKSDKIKKDNIGKGIKVTASAANDVWAAKTKTIKLKSGNNTVDMALGNANGLVNREDQLLLLVDTNDSQDATAVLTNTNGVVDGATYTTNLTFTFTKM